MIFRAPEPDLIIPDVALTPFLLERTAALGDKAAFIDGPTGRTLTYRAWAGAVRKAAAGLSGRGFRKGDVFAIYSPNLPEYAVAFHAVSLLGGIVTTINPAYTAAELSHQLEDAGARALVTVPPCLDKAAHAAREAGVREVFVFGEATGATPFDVLLESDGDPPAVAIDPRTQVVVLPYSSGTTGLPKGVMLTHRNLVANMLQSAPVLSIGERDVMLGVLPFFHIYGMVVIMNLGMHLGATVVTMPRFDLEQCLQTIQKYRVTFANVVPPIVLALAKSPLVDKYDLQSRAHAVLGRRAAVGIRGRRRQRAARLPRHPGLRPHRDISGHARHAHARRTDQGRRDRTRPSRTPRSASSMSRPAQSSDRSRRAKSACAGRR